VLTALRRTGKPYRLTACQLRGAGMVSAAAVTKRITRLEAVSWSGSPTRPTAVARSSA
jgi:hypothetical protein